MNVFFYLFIALIGFFVFLFVWSLRNPKRSLTRSPGKNFAENCGQSAVAHLPQIRQALARMDGEFVAEKVPRRVLRRMQKERRRVALDYLSALRMDFDGLLRTARVIAALSPEVAAVQELERLRLTVNFLWRYRLARMRVWTGFAPLPQIDGLSNLLSGFSVRLETIMKELGERAALVAEMASSPDRRSIHPA